MGVEEQQTIGEIIAWLKAKPSIELADDLELTTKLRELKELTRNKADSESLYKEQSIAALIDYAFISAPRCRDWIIEAQKCLANALTLEYRCTQYFLRSDGLSKLFSCGTAELAACIFEEQFLHARILFLLTAKAGASMQADVEDNHADITAVLGDWLRRHHESLLTQNSQLESPELGASITAWNELLKTLYNCALFYPKVLKGVLNRSDPYHTRASALIMERIAVLYAYPLAPIKSVIPHYINLLTSLEYTFEDGDTKLYAPLLEILDQFVSAALQDTTWYELQISESQLAPLLSFIMTALDHDQSIEGSGKVFLAQMLLVPTEQRSVALGKSGTLPAKLLQLFNSSSITLRDCIGTLLFVASGRKAARFIENVGYGHAIGYLTSNKIKFHLCDIPAVHKGQAINPITGQNISDEEVELAQKELQEMTDEEKEREAEKLFVLFQRLKKTGIVDVEDPIQKAVNEGRFQEL